MEVTTTSTKSGKFDSRLFHLVYEEEFARVKDHLGPINSLAFHPDGKSYATGGEDGFVRVQVFRYGIVYITLIEIIRKIKFIIFKTFSTGMPAMELLESCAFETFVKS